MKPINLVHRGVDSNNEYWAEEHEAFLADDFTVVKFEEDSLQIYRFPHSLAGKDEVDYCSEDDRVKRAEIHFEGIDVKSIDITKPLVEIITKL